MVGSCMKLDPEVVGGSGIIRGGCTEDSEGSCNHTWYQRMDVEDMELFSGVSYYYYYYYMYMRINI